MGSTVKKEEGGLWETIKVIIQALLIAVVVRTVLFQPFNIPSGSLIPTLLIGDYLFVSKYSYGYSKHSIPFSPPLFSGRIFGSEPKRGDIAVFKLPKDNSTDYIKRVIGLPGDKIQVIGGVLHINGQPVQRERVEDYKTTDLYGRTDRGAPVTGRRFPDGASHFVIERDGDRGYWDNTNVYTVQPGHFFMMGDNRDNSTDSRDEASVGAGAVRESRRPRRNHLLLHRRERVPVASVGMAADRSAGTACSSGSAEPVARRKPNLDELLNKLGYRFEKPELLDEALTHVSAPKADGQSYQRLEFLGDRVLGLAIAELLYRDLSGRAGGRAVPAPGGTRAARELRRGRHRLGCRALSQARRRRGAFGRAAQPDHPGRCVRGDHRRGLPRWRLRGRQRRSSSAPSSELLDGAAPPPARSRRAPCRNGRRGRACRRRPTPSSSRPAPTMRRSSGSW